jgi:hypothetical protein
MYFVNSLRINYVTILLILGWDMELEETYKITVNSLVTCSAKDHIIML